jgi:hypothetical protein
MLPKRLLAEGFMHRGLASIRLRTEDNLTKGREDLLRAIILAEEDRRPKIKLAALLGLAESYVADQPKALSFWNEALAMLQTVRSTFLRQWSDELAPQVRGPLTIEIKPTTSLEKAQEAFEKAFLVYHLMAGNLPPREREDPDQGSRPTLMNRSKFQRLWREHKKELLLDRGYEVVCLFCRQTVGLYAQGKSEKIREDSEKHLRLSHEKHVSLNGQALFDHVRVTTRWTRALSVGTRRR